MKKNLFRNGWNPVITKTIWGGTLINKRKHNFGWNPNKRNEKLEYFEIPNRKIDGSQKVQIIHDVDRVQKS